MMAKTTIQTGHILRHQRRRLLSEHEYRLAAVPLLGIRPSYAPVSVAAASAVSPVARKYGLTSLHCAGPDRVAIGAPQHRRGALRRGEA